jgi:hypothetical protein
MDLRSFVALWAAIVAAESAVPIKLAILRIAHATCAAPHDHPEHAAIVIPTRWRQRGVK